MDSLTSFLLGGATVLALTQARSRLTGFAAQRPEDYAASQPQFDLRRHLNGEIDCEGAIFGPTGRVTSRFTGDFLARWDGNHGTMREHFRFDSGAEQHREWQLTLGNGNSFEATAPDVVGTGRGTVSGPAVQLAYRLRLPKDAGGHVVSVNDWMYLAPNGHIVNRSEFRKFGIRVAELIATMRPRVPA